MTPGTDHPENLPWYVAGRLRPDESREVDAHLASCAGCREEVRALTSMKTSLEEVHGSGHVKTEDLVAYENGTSTQSDLLRAEIESHVSACARCAADLASLRAASEADASTTRAEAGPAARPSRRRWWVAAAVLATAALAVPALRILMPPREGQITFLPTLRGPAQPSILKGSGPWTVTVILPLKAPSGTYSVHLEPEDGSTPLSLKEAVAESDPKCLRIVVPPLRGASSFRMVVQARQQPDIPPYSYTFSVAPSDPQNPKDADR